MIGKHYLVDVIASFNTEEKIKPLYLRLEDESHNIQTVTIDRIIADKEQQLAGTKMIKYYCQLSVGKESRTCKLGYNVERNSWWIYNDKM